MLKIDNIFVLSFLSLILSSCCELGIPAGACCGDDKIGELLLSDTELSYIPYTSFNNTFYTSQNGSEVFASIQNFDRDLYKLSFDDHSCDYHTYERKSGRVYFFSIDLAFDITLDTYPHANMTILAKSLDEIDNAYHTVEETSLKPDCSKFYNDSFELLTQDTLVFGFQFHNAMVFENCDNSQVLDKLILSPDLGIDMIIFNDSTFLKLNN
ncbi:MAG: hypothetical protein OEW67_10155 [Cyclobacteriaceae bacterium]|nr:hypothetical protein [Cyclobacteriaceae bacterium]